MAVRGRRKGLGVLDMMVILTMVQGMLGESILDFLRRRSDLSQVRGITLSEQLLTIPYSLHEEKLC